MWPRPVVLLEADPAGGDLAYRCRAAHAGGALVYPAGGPRGGPGRENRALLGLPAAAREGRRGRDVVFDESQLLACGVNLIQGVPSSAQARGLAALWQTLGQACTTA